VPKKAVLIYFLAAFAGAAIFIYFTFPRAKDEIPTSNNQRPFPSAPGPNNIPDTVPHPSAPTPQHGPTLRIMGWATGPEVKKLEAQLDAYQAQTGQYASLQLDGDAASYARDLREALASGTPPDVCLVDARHFSGLDPVRDLVDATPLPDSAPRSVAAFTVDGQIKAVPDEFSVELLFYNPQYFDEAGIGYPDVHWNWDILESISRAIASLKIKDSTGQPIYPLELPANFDLWNILCTQAGHPALDRDVWHLTDADGKDSHLRALDLINETFHQYAIAAPPPKPNEMPGRNFAQQRAALLIGPSQLTASLTGFPYAVTLLPGDISRATLAQVNGWAVPMCSTHQEDAHRLAGFLARQPLHAGWSSVLKPTDNSDTTTALCYEALSQALVPRIEVKTAPLAQFLDQQIDQLARGASAQKTDVLYAHIQSEYQNGYATPVVSSALPQAAALKPGSSSTEIRGL
jgi:ABC-type glycerol-3-phosphate transport system substrate-binding protein